MDGFECVMTPTTAEQASFALSITQNTEGSGATAVISVPLGVYLAHGILIDVDGGRPFQARYEICDRSTCFAGFQMSDRVLSAFKRGLNARLRVWVGRERAAVFEVSLKGFSAAWSALQESRQ